MVYFPNDTLEKVSRPRPYQYGFYSHLVMSLLLAGPNKRMAHSMGVMTSIWLLMPVFMKYCVAISAAFGNSEFQGCDPNLGWNDVLGNRCLNRICHLLRQCRPCKKCKPLEELVLLAVAVRVVGTSHTGLPYSSWIPYSARQLWT